jgi:hypothetical protein
MSCVLAFIFHRWGQHAFALGPDLCGRRLVATAAEDRCLNIRSNPRTSSAAARRAI